MTAVPPQPLDRIRPDVRAMHAYVVQDATGYLKLDAMENPYSLPPDLQAALASAWGSLRSTATPARAMPTCAPHWRSTPVCRKGTR